MLFEVFEKDSRKHWFIQIAQEIVLMLPETDDISIALAEIFIRESINYRIHPRIGKDENTHDSDWNTWFDLEITQLSKQEVELIWQPTDYES